MTVLARMYLDLRNDRWTHAAALLELSRRTGIDRDTIARVLNRALSEPTTTTREGT